MTNERGFVRRVAVLCGIFLLVRGSMEQGAAQGAAQGADAARAVAQPDAGQHQPSPEQQKAAQDWAPLEEKCMSAIKDAIKDAIGDATKDATKDAIGAQGVQEAVDSCKQTLDMSMKAGDLTSSTQLARTGSYQLYGHALLLADKKQAALAQEYMAVDEAHKCLTDKDQEYAMPYFWRGVVEANLGQNDAALADYTVAEATHRKAIANMPAMKPRYGPTLAAILKEHAALLDKMGRADEAAKLRAEAAGL